MNFIKSAVAAAAGGAILAVSAGAASAATYTFTFGSGTTSGNPSQVTVTSDGPGETIDMTISGYLYTPGATYSPGDAIDVDSNASGLISRNLVEESGSNEHHTLDSRAPEGTESFLFALDGPGTYILSGIEIGWSEVWVGGAYSYQSLCADPDRASPYHCSTSDIAYGPESFAFYDLFVDGGYVGNTYLDGELTPTVAGNEFAIGVRGFTEYVEALYSDQSCGYQALDGEGCEPLLYTLDFGIKIKSLTFEYVPPTEIPLPAAGWLLIAGLAGMAGLKRRKAV